VVKSKTCIFLQLVDNFRLHGKAVFIVGELGLLDFADVVLNSLELEVVGIGIYFHEFWGKSLEKSQDIVENKNLAIAVDAAADADGDALHFLSDYLGQLARNSFQNDSKDTLFIQGHSVIEDFLGGIQGLALHLESAQASCSLGCKPDMTEHRDAGFDNGTDRLGKS